jgi:hypothetical protein
MKNPLFWLGQIVGFLQTSAVLFMSFPADRDAQINEISALTEMLPINSHFPGRRTKALMRKGCVEQSLFAAAAILARFALSQIGRFPAKKLSATQ